MSMCHIHISPHPVWLLPTYTIVDFSINRVYTIPLNSQSCEVLQRCLVAIADYQKWSNAIEKNPYKIKHPKSSRPMPTPISFF